VATEHQFVVPLDHGDPSGESITVFAREVVAPRKQRDTLPWLVYLQGGPGFMSPRPTTRSGWLGRVLQDHRVLLLDQRGTGRSSRVTRHSLLGRDPVGAADYLSHFRADSIVRDAELIRHELVGDDRRWTVLGQSYGGFAALTYLSFAPEGLSQVLVTGGLPPLTAHPDDVYRATYPRVADRLARFTDRYPDDRDRLDAIADHVAKVDVPLPSGMRLTVPRLQSLGHALGRSDGFEVLHHLLELAWDGTELADEFLHDVDHHTGFAAAPLYAVMHESIYCQGLASRWSAQRVRDSMPELSPDVRPLQLTGEMIYPWMFEDEPALLPLRELADLLAERETWPALYDVDVLARNQVPVAAAIYHDDMYVDYDYSLATARQVGNARWWVTSEYAHDGLRTNPRVIERLLDLVTDEA
jgi:pimeloyl-ACP methyl ester carboxylesterase